MYMNIMLYSIFVVANQNLMAKENVIIAGIFMSYQNNIRMQTRTTICNPDDSTILLGLYGQLLFRCEDQSLHDHFIYIV